MSAAREQRLEDALRRVLSWPLPTGTVETYALPGWLAKIARDAIGDAPTAPTAPTTPEGRQSS